MKKVTAKIVAPQAFDDEDDTKIDPSALDIETARQAELFDKWARRFSKARREMDRLEYAADACESRLQLDCRNNPEKYGITNVTDKSVSALAKCHPKYAAAVEAYHRARFRCHRLENKVKAMDMRKSMLEALVKLFGQQYFAGPNVPRDLASLWEKYSTGKSEAANERQRRVRKEK